MKSLNLIAPDLVLNIINFQYIMTIFLCYTIGINTWAKENTHMKDKALLAEAYQLVSELNQTIQNCKQGLPDDLRLQQNIDEILRALKKAKS